MTNEWLPGGEVGRREGWITKGHEETCEGGGNIISVWQWFHGCLPMSKLIKLYSLNMYSLLYINYTSVKLGKNHDAI